MRTRIAEESAPRLANYRHIMTHFASSDTGKTSGGTIRPLTEDDREAVAQLTATDPARFLTPCMNLEGAGYESSLMRSWGTFDEAGGTLSGLLLRFSNTVVVADREGTCASLFAQVIDAERGLAGIRGTVEAVRALQPLLRNYTQTGWEDSYYLCLHRPPICAPELLAKARLARANDLEKLATLYAAAGTMYRNRANVAAKLEKERVFIVEEPGTGWRGARIVACALMNVESRTAGLIGGVFTLPEARGKGYAAACTAAISLSLQQDGKMPCLFYENPVAGRIYRRIGFEEEGHWGVLYLAPVRRAVS